VGHQCGGQAGQGCRPAKPAVEAFVDEEAGPEVVEKVRRRLQHFIDRKVAAQFEPLLAMARDEALTGLARGFAFRLSEAMGVLPRDAVATEVKELDQDARGACASTASASASSPSSCPRC
jgi:ATP-dependent RNA helicase SUPV3L1/SUV3